MRAKLRLTNHCASSLFWLHFKKVWLDVVSYNTCTGYFCSNLPDVFEYSAFLMTNTSGKNMIDLPNLIIE